MNDTFLLGKKEGKVERKWEKKIKLKHSTFHVVPLIFFIVLKREGRDYIRSSSGNHNSEDLNGLIILKQVTPNRIGTQQKPG